MTATRLTSLASREADDPTPFTGLVRVPTRVLRMAMKNKRMPKGYYVTCADAGRALVAALAAFCYEQEGRVKW